MEARHAISVAFGLVSAAAFLLVARAVARRAVSAPNVGARNAFVTWWLALAGVSLVGSTQIALAPWTRDVSLHLTLVLVTLGGLCLALWGLLHYLLFLVTNSARVRVPLAAAYGALFVGLVYLLLRGQATGLESERWGVALAFADDVSGTPVSYLVFGAIVLPQLIASLLYLTFYFRVHDALQRRRVLLVGGSIFLWFASAIPSGMPQLQASDAWQVATRLVGLCAAGAIYYAYTRLRSPPDGAPPREKGSPQGVSAGSDEGSGRRLDVA